MNPTQAAIGETEIELTIDADPLEFEAHLAPLLRVGKIIEAEITLSPAGFGRWDSFKLPIIAKGDSKAARDTVREHLSTRPPAFLDELQATILRLEALTK